MNLGTKYHLGCTLSDLGSRTSRAKHPGRIAFPRKVVMFYEDMFGP